jgi:ATP-dependent RNA helicase DDX5/DBP2
MIHLQGRDCVGVAKTGSGKTLGFLIPAFIRITTERRDPRAGPAVLVLAPTRELACQIREEVVKFGTTSGITSACLYGGAPKNSQLGEIRRGIHVVIATPGRLNDFLEMGSINLRQVVYLVFDEADRMLDMGFEPQIRKVLQHVPVSRQTLFFTATWPREVSRLYFLLRSHTR